MFTESMTLVLIRHGNMLPRLGIDLVVLQGMFDINVKHRQPHRLATLTDYTQVTP